MVANPCVRIMSPEAHFQPDKSRHYHVKSTQIGKYPLLGKTGNLTYLGSQLTSFLGT